MFGNAFYRNFLYKMVTHARVFSLSSNNFNLNNKNGLFISASLRFISNLFGFDNMCSWEKIRNKKIRLPLKNGKIDFDYMETLISAVQKLVIKDVVDYADKKLVYTRLCVKEQHTSISENLVQD